MNNFRIVLPVVSVAKGPALPPPDDKVGDGIKADVGVDIRDDGAPVRLYRR